MEAPAVRAAYYAAFHQGSHLQQVQRLYRYGIKNILNYAVQRDVFHVEAAKLRAEFDQNKNSSEGKALLSKGIEKLHSMEHPDGWVLNTSYGGGKWQRNVPIPDAVSITLDYGKEPR
mmetsp:Transcript_7411/g.12795  ORF Transcript_7411/g.12795 Transcript_7411/m.12795 type:complete len:117 (+) Transcript_7411:101-451(+)|eukprot:CAMPEP_0198205070 /NCGR_PEP_ID=MMETSP1445-20131203/8551_1 /TAXON_ID=36898 /ORGANISM="Pyramimonas sp., Strain CCMP2087" /LENGTH=116 /DNA_ID=CAMNT_0043877217 /DNA_START=109 /DNA_END=459 /DNA_ORIENTATION=+